MFSALELPLGTSGFLCNLRGTAVDLITNALPVLVFLYCILALFCPEIAAVSVDNGFFVGQQL